MWKLYDELIAGIPDDIIVEKYQFGKHFSMLCAGEYNGVAHSFFQSTIAPIHDAPPVGRSLRSVAEGIKSWNFKEATAGMAAINAYYNSRKNVEVIGLSAFSDGESSQEARKKHNPLSNPAEQIKGKKVVVIGHFPHIEKTLGDICDLYILEQNPQKGDYPASACEFLLPEMDYIYATGMTIANKTLPRLLQLKRPGACFTLVGPSGPLTPVMFRYGIDVVASFVVTDPELVWGKIMSDQLGIFQGGKMVEYMSE